LLSRIAQNGSVLSEWRNHVQQILSVWSSLNARRRLVVVGATLLMFLAVLGLSRMASQPSFSLLYSGLEPAAAGEVVAALEQRGVAYDVRNGAIFVDSAQRDSLRMTLASEGLPANGAVGYELLDSLTGFGTTSQMFDAAYWRAKEGELARTIAANPQIRSARVHISNPPSTPFQRSLKPTASVQITGGGGNLSPAQAKALKHLVSSAVAGMSPADVSIIDTDGALVTSEDVLALNGSDRASVIKAKLVSILEPRVGRGKAVVEVNVDTVTESEAIHETIVDPDSSVVISSNTEEVSVTSSGTDSGSVTVASNVPDGEAAGGQSNSQSESTEVRETKNIAVSETTREVLRAPGAVKRISVAVLVDGLRSEDPATGGLIWEPRSDAELADLRELVASSMGFDAERGDSITIKSMEFEPVEPIGPGEDPSFLSQLSLNPMTLIQMAILGVVALILGLFVVRPILASRPATAALPAPVPAAGAGGVAGPPTARETDGLTPTTASEALTGEIDDGVEPMSTMPVLGGEDDLGDIMPVPGFQYEEDPVDRLRQLIQDRREETVEILRGWMDEEEIEESA